MHHVMGIRVVDLKDIKEVSRSDKKVSCTATALLNNTMIQKVHYDFMKNGDDDVLVQVNFN
jgi:hypothetical protein